MVRTPAIPAFPLLRAADRSVSTLNDQERTARGKMVYGLMLTACMTRRRDAGGMPQILLK
jgi:hypothetical protein